MLRLIELLLWIILAMLTVVVPNAYKEVSGATLVVLAVYYLMVNKQAGLHRNFILMWAASAVVTLGYLFVGYLNGAPEDAFFQIPFVYIVSPMLWAIALHGALLRYGIVKVVDALIILMVAAIASQAYYFWAYSALGPQAVEFMAGTPNVDLTNDSVAAVMYVFGSMIFLYGGLMASPEIIRSKLLRYGLVLLAIGSTFTSGRSALILSLFLGASVSLVASPMFVRKRSSNAILNIVIIGAVFVVCGAVLARLYGVDILVPLENLLDKVVSGGGAGRSDYSPELFYGALNGGFLGAGHGVGVRYVVDYRYPWRYEVVGLATLYRVGIFGAVIYALPFVFAITKSLRLWRSNLLTPQEKFLCAGLIAAFVATNTNPYIEAYAFQWMYVLPSVYFIGLRKSAETTAHSGGFEHPTSNRSIIQHFKR